MRTIINEDNEKIAIGAVIRERLRESRHSVVWLAEQLECSRTNVYKIFAKSSIDSHDLLRISELLNFDFFRIYSDRLSRRRRKTS